jgi:hypothetical protein
LPNVADEKPGTKKEKSTCGGEARERRVISFDGKADGGTQALEALPGGGCTYPRGDELLGKHRRRRRELDLLPRGGVRDAGAERRCEHD